MEKDRAPVLTLNEYQKACADTAIYPEHDTGSITALSYVALGMGEAGELQGKVKKIIRDGTRDDDAMTAEAGDVLWYIARFCSELGISLEDAALRNLDKLRSRKERGALVGSGDAR